MASPFRANTDEERLRLNALGQYDLSVHRDRLDEIANLACNLSETPIASITVVDAAGLTLIGCSGDEICLPPFEQSFSRHVIAAREPLLIPDVCKDSRFAEHPLVNETPPVCFYAGWPLVTPGGHAIGTLCVMDYRPRSLSASQQDGLRVLGGQVTTLLELDLERRIRARDEAHLKIVAENAHVGLAVIDAAHNYVYTNTTYLDILGNRMADVTGLAVSQVLSSVYEAQVRPYLEQAFAGVSVRYELRGAGAADGRYFEVNFQPSWVDGRVNQVLAAVTDITQYSIVQNASRRLAAIVESSRDAIISKDLTGIVTTWNTGAARMFGYSEEEMVGTPILRLIPEDRQQEEFDILERIAAGEIVENFDTRRLTRDGRVIDVSVTVSPIKDSAGNIVGASKVARDISSRVRAEEQLRRRTAMLEAEHELTPDGILAMNEQGRVLLFNSRFCAMWGLSADMLTTKTDAELLDIIRDKLVAPDEFMAKVLHLYSDHDAVSQDEVRLADGRILDRHSAPMRDAKGTYYGRIWYFHDVTEQRRAGEALLAAEERMRFAMESTGLGIWDMDYTTGKLNWSETLERLHGLAPGTFGGTLEAYHDLIHSDDRASLSQIVERTQQSGGDFSVQYRVVLPDGNLKWISGAGRILRDEDGKLQRGVGIGMDVTERHLLEEQYHQAQKMEAIGRFAGGMAHDFNNLLTAILGYCELLLADRGEADPSRGDILEIQKAGNLAAALTSQLLAFSRRQIVAPAVLDLNDIVSKMHDMLKRLIGEDVKVVMNLKEGVSPVKADRNQLEQVVMNLAVNARDAMPQGGTLTIETDDVVLDERYARRHLKIEPGPYVALVVSDTGMGIPPEVQPRVFEPFFTTKEPGKGTGLGLATVHGIVSQWGGSIGIYSEIDHGTSFRMYLPVSQDETGHVRQVASVRPHAGSETVLVVEDADTLRVLARRQLKRQGYQVLVAANAVEAMQVFEENSNIDVLLTDVVMPGASGPEMVAQLIDRQPSLKVIYMSGFTQDAVTEQVVLASGAGFLQKPFSSDSLGQKIREVLDGRPDDANR